MPPTLRELSVLTGLHPSTLSRILNGDPTLKVPDETRQRALEAARRIGYQPNHLARSLKLRRTFALGMVVPDVTDPIFAILFRGAQEASRRRDYQVVLASTDDDLETQAREVRFLLERRVDGLLLATAQRQDAAVEGLEEAGVPVVLINRCPDDWHDRSVTPNDRLGGYLATRHLLDLGHRRIAHLAGPQAMSTAYHRKLGFLQALEEDGLDPAAAQIADSHFREEAGESGMAELLALKETPTAIFAVNDLTAIGAMVVIRAAGLHVPEDISIVGYNDIPLVSKLEPALTTVRVPLTRMGATAAEMLIDLLDEPNRPAGAVSLDPELVVRSSTAPPR